MGVRSPVVWVLSLEFSSTAPSPLPCACVRLGTMALHVGDYTALLDSAARASMRVLCDDRTVEDFKSIEGWLRRVSALECRWGTAVWVEGRLAKRAWLYEAGECGVCKF